MEGKRTRWRSGEGLKDRNPLGEVERGEIKMRRQKACVYAACQGQNLLEVKMPRSKHISLPLTHQELFMQMTSDIPSSKYIHRFSYSF